MSGIDQHNDHPAQVVAKDLYEIDEIPPLGHVPKYMYACVCDGSGMGIQSL